MDYSELDVYIDAIGAERVVANLGQQLTEPRLTSIERVVTARLHGVHVAAERPGDPYNAAALVRTAEALGVLHVHVVGVADGSLHARRTTQGSFNWVHTSHHEDFAAFHGTLRKQGVKLFGALMEGECALEELPVDAPFCLLFGNETTGLSQEALAACDVRFRVPMFGMSESLNLSVSAAISMYATCGARRRLLGRMTDMTDDELMRARARYYARSVDLRALQALMP